MPETSPPRNRITFWRTRRELLILAMCPRHAEGAVTAFKLRALRTLGTAGPGRAASRIEALTSDFNDARGGPLHRLVAFPAVLLILAAAWQHRWSRRCSSTTTAEAASKSALKPSS